MRKATVRKMINGVNMGYEGKQPFSHFQSMKRVRRWSWPLSGGSVETRSSSHGDILCREPLKSFGVRKGCYEEKAPLEMISR